MAVVVIEQGFVKVVGFPFEGYVIVGKGEEGRETEIAGG